MSGLFETDCDKGTFSGNSSVSVIHNHIKNYTITPAVDCELHITSMDGITSKRTNEC